MSEASLRARVDPRFQVALIVLSACIIGAQVYLRMKSPKMHETFADFTTEYSAPNTATPLAITLHIDEFQEFDTRQGKFLFSGSVWLATDQKDFDLDALGNFSFENGHILKRSDPIIKQSSSGAHRVGYRVRVKISHPMNQKDFPLDAHRLFISIIHHAPNATFDQQHFVFDSSLAVFGWRKTSLDTQTGFQIERLDPAKEAKDVILPTAVFAIDFERSGMQHLLLALIPLLFIFYMALLSLSTGPKTIAPMASILVAIPGYRIVMQNITPQAGYLVISDYLYFIFLIFTCFCFFFNVLTSFAADIDRRVMATVVLFIHASVLFCSTYVFWFL